MAACAEFEVPLDSNYIADINQQFLTISPKSIEDCTGFVLLSADEYTNLPTLVDIFAMPLADDLQQMFEMGFVLPLLAYLTAWAYAVVINWFNHLEKD
ncbi:hypothetical protein KFZ76_08580 [Methylovulum psychrotolerans]|uniref:hypothetical protein n=1 Tax=Methylovulum psychrotolerans TaxID=1704499 RepID=UPI001BFEEFEB|nr:hypothetical protein [Methylovulum psychrotolerans]MBT9097761.1 hypothetical protein [Methylovulum psychrotolerans]